MGGRQSSVSGEDRPRSNSVDTSATIAESRPPTRGASRSVISATDFLQALRAPRLDGSDDSDDEQPGPSRLPGLPPSGRRHDGVARHHSNHGGVPSSNSRPRTQRVHAIRRPMPFFVLDVTCPVCQKRVPSDEAEVHLVICFTRPRLTYNDDVLREDKGECSICLEEMQQGDSIARLPCLCIYHKVCIDEWFKRKNCCPEHPGDESITKGLYYGPEIPSIKLNVFGFSLIFSPRLCSAC
ncbi:unnamed protein product, partial [Mesorhabditis belari]|uniref:E3 ubiquitin-protein ligase ZNRF1 n=1 Tax=Mesorhabditis belari TaxID=2138241 RepID=A0AAF3FEB0_9BILA